MVLTTSRVGNSPNFQKRGKQKPRIFLLYPTYDDLLLPETTVYLMFTFSGFCGTTGKLHRNEFYLAFLVALSFLFSCRYGWGVFLCILVHFHSHRTHSPICPSIHMYIVWVHTPRFLSLNVSRPGVNGERVIKLSCGKHFCGLLEKFDDCQNNDFELFLSGLCLTASGPYDFNWFGFLLPTLRSRCELCRKVCISQR